MSSQSAPTIAGKLPDMLRNVTAIGNDLVFRGSVASPTLRIDGMTIAGAQMIWTNKLAIDGTISVLAPIATSPTNISYSLSGNTLTLSWPDNYLTWSLQSNIVGVASSGNWFTVPNSSSGTQFVITINPARSNVFYRLIAP